MSHSSLADLDLVKARFYATPTSDLQATTTMVLLLKKGTTRLDPL